MKKIWHPYHLWEEYHAGMWSRLTSKEEQEVLIKCIAFTGDHKLYGSYMRRVVREWKYSCEHNLTDVSLNRLAWIGHSAAALYDRLPEYLVRRAWGMLTDRQRELADNEAFLALTEWTEKHDTQASLQF